MDTLIFASIRNISQMSVIIEIKRLYCKISDNEEYLFNV